MQPQAFKKFAPAIVPTITNTDIMSVMGNCILEVIN